MTIQLDRRGFLKATSALGATLVVGFGAGGRLAVADNHSAADLNAFVSVGDDDSVTAIVKHFEMRQGTTTGLSTLLAEEMDVPWENVRVSFAPSNNDLSKNLAFGGGVQPRWYLWIH
ncbi:MAG: twin-arginine translocation signal domain-containing protein [Pseudomonadota bacterium]